MARYTQPISSPHEKLTIQWISDKYINFTKNKIYIAEPSARGITKNAPYHNFRITDDEGDYYTLDKRDINKKYIIKED